MRSGLSYEVCDEALFRCDRCKQFKSAEKVNIGIETVVCNRCFSSSIKANNGYDKVKKKCLGRNMNGEVCEREFVSKSKGHRFCPNCKAILDYGKRYPRAEAFANMNAS